MASGCAKGHSGWTLGKTSRMEMFWHRLPREVLELVFQSCGDVLLRDIVQWAVLVVDEWLD